MKLQITISQWGELTHEEKNKLDDFGALHKWNLDIGELIWYLGDDFLEIFKYKGEKNFNVGLRKARGNFKAEELIDCLWESVKFKLKQ